jgi:hypothetical protein
MKNYPPRARPVVPQGCATEAYATSARAKAIACSLTAIRFRCNKTDQTDGEASVRHGTHGFPFADEPGCVAHARGQAHCRWNAGGFFDKI